MKGKKLYDTLNGREIFLYTIESGNTEVDICDLGARINALRVNGTDVVVGFDCVKDYFDSGIYAGATIGRVCNRISGGRFVLNGKEYNLSLNDGKNHLHGGNFGFDKKVFDVVKYDCNSVMLQYVSVDGEENYPGTLVLTVKYTVNDDAVTIEFAAKCDKDTLWAPTNHAYFNLDGESAGDCVNNLLKIDADYYTPLNEDFVPTGEKIQVYGTPFDFKTQKRIGADFCDDELLKTNGYDHNFILNGEYAAHAESAKTGIMMDLYTNLPCLQLYTGGQIKNCKGKTGNYGKWSGFCLEPQYCPNAINMCDFEKPVLKKGEEKKHYIKFCFHVKK